MMSTEGQGGPYGRLVLVAVSEDEPGLYNRPVLVTDADAHTAVVKRLDADREGRVLVTASDDKTVRIWAAGDGRLLRTIRLPAGPGNVGKAYAAAISPDGTLVAIGGFTSSPGTEENVYIFDATSGQLLTRSKLPGSAFSLAFSPDGTRLAAGFEGISLIDPTSGRVVATDMAYGRASYGVVFDRAGRLASTSLDGKVRLYDPRLRLLRVTKPQGGKQPYGIAFSPDGSKLAVGYSDTIAIDVLDGSTLRRLFSADTSGVAASLPPPFDSVYMSLDTVAWSGDGRNLYATGRSQFTEGEQGIWIGGIFMRGLRLRCWPEGGRGKPFDVRLGISDKIMALRALLSGGLAFVAGDTRLGVLGGDGRKVWTVEPVIADYRDQRGVFAVSADGARVQFGYEYGGKSPAVFSLPERRLMPGREADGLATARSEAPGLAVEDWMDGLEPTLNGTRLELGAGEHALSLAVAPDGLTFALGAEWSLRLFGRDGTQLWYQPVPDVVWDVNVSGDGRLLVAAYGDGTIRWHRMQDGVELLAFLPLADRVNWVAWTPEGLYAATPGARGVLRWHVNHGWIRAPESIPVYQIPEQHRPDVLPFVLREMDEVRALGLAERKKIREAVYRRTGGDPAERLHLLAIGVSEYKEEHARHLRLRFADADARDVASALSDSQKSLYAEVTIQTLRNETATRRSILRGLDTIRQEMGKATGRDLAVVQFSGHGAVVDGELYLLPHEIDPRTTVELKDTALSFAQLRQELLGIAHYGRVLVLLDACHSGTATMDGAKVVLDAAAARAALAGPNVTVLTSAAPAHPSFEDERWANGAFTEAFLDALRSHADRDHDGLLSVGDIEWHVAHLLPELTGGRQHLGIEKRFDGSIFVAGL